MRGFLVLTLVACTSSESVPCGKWTCGPGTVCGFLNDEDQMRTPVCLTPDQARVCRTSDDGARCVADGKSQICVQHYCLPGCGDGTLDVGEECDDGNFVSHDGCSSSCLSEFAGWREWKSDWRGRSGHVAGYHAQSQQLVMLGGADTLGGVGDQWIRGPQGTWTRSQPVVALRNYAAMAYDSVRGKLVLFGGVSDQLLGDTWEFDGATWTKQAPTTSPPARSAAGMAFDASTGRIVLFGGRFIDSYANDTWEYNGTTWTQVTVASPPVARQWPALAYDAARSRIVMFGGYRTGSLFDTWEYAGGAWTAIAQTTRPQARFGAMMTFSTARNKIVLYGGALNLVQGASDTWEYDGTWTPIAPSVSPPARGWATLTDEPAGPVLVQGVGNSQLHLGDVWRYANGTWTDVTPDFSPSTRHTTLVYDGSRHEAVLFSGCSAGAFSVPETWAFRRVSGTNDFKWVLASDTSEPAKRCYAALTYDSRREAVMLFGGSTAGATANLADTWQWNGAGWTKVETTVQPTPRLDAAFAEHPHDGVSLLFGGRSDVASPLNETWELDGATWTKRMTPDALVAQHGATMAYDPDLERVVLFDVTGQTWQYQDHVWTPLELTTSPPARTNARMVWDPWRHRIVLFGGTGTQSLVDYSDLWELHDTTWERVRLLGAQPPTRPRPALAAYPELRGLVMFGGVARDDTWMLQYVSETAEEKCNNERDDDGDLQIDTADPDCKLYP